MEFEETLGDRPWGQRSKELLSIPDLCQELGVGRSWVLTKLNTGEIPSIKLDQTIKVKREDLAKYLDSQR
jgi:excisionase family DNA binding protein